MPDQSHQTPKTAKFHLPPPRQSNKATRSREYLTTHEVDVLRKAARGIGRYEVRPRSTE